MNTKILYAILAIGILTAFNEDHIAMGGSWASTGYDVRNESEMTFADANPYVGFRPVMVIK